MRLKNLVVVFLIVSSGIAYYILTEPGRQEFFVSDVIDGDTFGSREIRVRLMGVNTPEKGMFLYEEARDFFDDSIYGRIVSIENCGFDKYGRILGYVFSDNALVNEIILGAGFGSLYYYEKDRYFKRMMKAEEIAREEGKGIWRKSSNFGCLNLIEFSYKEPEKIVFENVCGNIGVVLKDDATHIYYENISSGFWEKNFSHIWNDEGDSLYIWDDSGLVLFYRY